MTKYNHIPKLAIKIDNFISFANILIVFRDTDCEFCNLADKHIILHYNVVKNDCDKCLKEKCYFHLHLDRMARHIFCNL